MADRTAASAFGAAFAWQAKHRKPKLTKWLWTLADQYDFTPDQMYADEELLKLGLISKKDAGPEPSSALSFGPASLKPLFEVFERDLSYSEREARSRSAELARLSGKKDPLARPKSDAPIAEAEKWVTKTIQKDYEKAREFQPLKATESAASGFGRWVADNKIVAGLAVAAAAAVALAPATASAVVASANTTPAQLAQAQADAQRAAATSNALKLAAGAFALVTAATITYAVVNEEPKKPAFHPISLYGR